MCEIEEVQLRRDWVKSMQFALNCGAFKEKIVEQLRKIKAGASER
jgi:hypothetical protein